jgi:hypothetical protein
VRYAQVTAKAVLQWLAVVRAAFLLLDADVSEMETRFAKVAEQAGSSKKNMEIVVFGRGAGRIGRTMNEYGAS